MIGGGFSLQVLDRENIRLGGPLDSVKACAEDWNTNVPTIFAVAVTWVAGGKVPATGKKQPFSSAIQLCAGTIKNIKKGQFDRFGNMSPGSWLGKIRDAWFSKSKYGWRPVGTVFFY